MRRAGVLKQPVAHEMTSPYELDHVFICTEPGAPAADKLVAFGLTEGTPNTHPGQGTTNRRFFFHNAMLELLWVHDEAEAASESVRPTGLYRRWMERHAGASPFGICLRPTGDADLEPPFPAFRYHPSFFPTPVFIGANADRVEQPLILYIPFARKPKPGTQPIDHPAGFVNVSAVRIKGPGLQSPSVELHAVERVGVAAFLENDLPLMEIGFDGERRGRSHSFEPDLPLKFCW